MNIKAIGRYLIDSSIVRAEGTSKGSGYTKEKEIYTNGKEDT